MAGSDLENAFRTVWPKPNIEGHTTDSLGSLQRGMTTSRLSLQLPARPQGLRPEPWLSVPAHRDAALLDLAHVLHSPRLRSRHIRRRMRLVVRGSRRLSG